MNGGTRLSYYKYTTEVNNLHIYFAVSVILHLTQGANPHFLGKTDMEYYKRL